MSMVEKWLTDYLFVPRSSGVWLQLVVSNDKYSLEDIFGVQKAFKFCLKAVNSNYGNETAKLQVMSCKKLADSKIEDSLIITYYELCQILFNIVSNRYNRIFAAIRSHI